MNYLITTNFTTRKMGNGVLSVGLVTNTCMWQHLILLNVKPRSNAFTIPSQMPAILADLASHHHLKILEVTLLPSLLFRQCGYYHAACLIISTDAGESALVICTDASYTARNLVCNAYCGSR